MFVFCQSWLSIDKASGPHALAILNHCHRDTQKTVLGETWWINFRERHHHHLTAWTSCAKRGPIKGYFRLYTGGAWVEGETSNLHLQQNRFTAVLCKKTSQGSHHHSGLPQQGCFHHYKVGYPGGPYNKEGIPNALYGKSPAGYMDLGPSQPHWYPPRLSLMLPTPPNIPHLQILHHYSRIDLLLSPFLRVKRLSPIPGIHLHLLFPTLTTPW